MDSITQISLGAAIGNAVAGEEAGNKGILWGGLAGLIPDLDVFFRYFYGQSEYFLIHRGITHSILFSILFSPILALLIYKVHKKSNIQYKKWWLLAFLALITHPLLDILTAYGTGFFEPFSNHRFSLPSISIVDPIYTIPIFIPLILILVAGRKKIVTKIFITGFIISHVYLVGTIANRFYIKQIFVNNFQEQGIIYNKMMVAPTIFNNILWYGVAVDNEHAWIGMYSHMDKDKNIKIDKIPINRFLQKEVSPGDFKNMERFSKGFYVLNKKDEGVIFNDLRFGFIDKGRYNFNYKFNTPEERPFNSSFSSGEFSGFYDRIIGI